MPVAPSSVLYYPTIDIRNETWLRGAVLFWDTIRTIVPDGIQHPYSGRLANELADEGMLIPIKVNSGMEEIESLSDDVLDYMTDPAAHHILMGTDDDAHVHRDKLPRDVRQIFEIHPEKLPYILREKMEVMASNKGFINVSKEFSNFYMTLLATRLADRLGLGMATESGMADQLAISLKKAPIAASQAHPRRGPYYDAYGPRRIAPKEIASGMLVDLMLKDIALPRKASTKTLIEFRRHHSEELATLRREVLRLVSDLPRDQSIEAMQQSVQDQYINNVTPALKSLRRSLSAQAWDTAINTFLKVSFLSAAPTTALIYAGVSAPVALFAGAGASVTAATVSLIRDRQNLREKNPYSYLLSVERGP